jgi:EAL domain-containing protein (putative c-di-GMP-specific phosphodiesterase class I)
MSEGCLLDGLLRPHALGMRFHPIFDLTTEPLTVHGVECLARGPQGTNLEQADLLFEYARRKRREHELDRACLATALEAIAGLPPTLQFTLNIHASTLAGDRRFVPFALDLAQTNGISPRRLTIEVVEHFPAWDVARLIAAIAALRAAGLRIALDDIGLGHSNYRMMLDCQPDYFKIDRYLVQGCDADAHRREILGSIVALARRFGSLVVAEGVERPEELAVLLDLEIRLAQGYLLSPCLTTEELLAAGRVPARSNGRLPRERTEP